MSWLRGSALLARLTLAGGLLLVLTGCGSALDFAPPVVPTAAVEDATAANDALAMDAEVGGVSPYALPFSTGTSVHIYGGPHADNFRSAPGGYTFSGQADVPASIDMGVAAGTPAHPIASGRVIVAWSECHLVVVDQGGGVWAAYLHLDVSVSVGDSVDRNSVLGRVKDSYPGTANCGDHSTASHVHFAFLSGSGKSGSYVNIAGRTLCGRTFDASGNLGNLGKDFTVPDCQSTGQGPTPTPTPRATPTPVKVTPPPAPVSSSCDTPSLSAPGAGATLAQSADISLYWSTNCPVSYAELTGGPYGSLSFGGWNAVTSVHIGTMWPGTYTWHVKGRSSSGSETGWSASRTFTVQSNGPTDPPAPIVTDPPAPIVTPTPTPTPTPIVTRTPTPTPTPTKTPCPFLDGGNGVTFYTGPNFTGQSWTWYVPAGQNDTYSELPGFLYQNLGSFWVANNAWHVVLYQGDNGTGNLGHYDASWPNVDSYWHNTRSVKIYINRTNC
jgi:murein DD-endopeptidase MepM/ murein hydrolase activator NlpD